MTNILDQVHQMNILDEGHRTNIILTRDVRRLFFDEGHSTNILDEGNLTKYPRSETFDDYLPEGHSTNIHMREYSWGIFRVHIHLMKVTCRSYLQYLIGRS